MLDLYGDKRYDIYWDEKGKVRRRGDDATLAAITPCPVVPWCCRSATNSCSPCSAAPRFPTGEEPVRRSLHAGAEGGCGWGQGLWDHWPIGWLNSQGNNWKPGSPYAYSFGSVGQFFVPRENGSSHSGRTIRHAAKTWNSTVGLPATYSMCCSVRPVDGTTFGGSVEVGWTRASSAPGRKVSPI